MIYNSTTTTLLLKTIISSQILSQTNEDRESDFKFHSKYQTNILNIDCIMIKFNV